MSNDKKRKNETSNYTEEDMYENGGELFKCNECHKIDSDYDLEECVFCNLYFCKGKCSKRKLILCDECYYMNCAYCKKERLDIERCLICEKLKCPHCNRYRDFDNGVCYKCKFIGQKLGNELNQKINNFGDVLFVFKD